MDLTSAKWFESSCSSGNGQCVEVAVLDDGVAVRDTMDRSKADHVFTSAEWAAFVDGVKAG